MHEGAHCGAWPNVQEPLRVGIQCFADLGRPINVVREHGASQFLCGLCRQVTCLRPFDGLLHGRFHQLVVERHRDRQVFRSDCQGRATAQLVGAGLVVASLGNSQGVLEVLQVGWLARHNKRGARVDQRQPNRTALCSGLIDDGLDLLGGRAVDRQHGGGLLLIGICSAQRWAVAWVSRDTGVAGGAARCRADQPSNRENLRWAQLVGSFLVSKAGQLQACFGIGDSKDTL